MTTFVDGPAKGQHLLLKSSPDVLRVVHDIKTGKWDALDQPGDIPGPSENIFTYRLKERRGACHLYFGSRGGGFYPISDYEYQGDHDE